MDVMASHSLARGIYLLVRVNVKGSILGFEEVTFGQH